MLLICSLLILLLSAAALTVFIHRSYLRDRSGPSSLLIAIGGFNVVILAVCIYHAQYGLNNYLFNRYLFLGPRLLALFRAIPLNLFWITDLLTLGRVMFLVGIYCFVVPLTNRRMQFKNDWVLGIPLFFLLLNISPVYRELIALLRESGYSLARGIYLFDMVCRVGILTLLPVLVARLLLARRRTDHPKMRRNLLLLTLGVSLVWLEFTLIIDLTPSSIANVYSDPIMLQVLNDVVLGSVSQGRFITLYLLVLLLVLGSFSLLIFTGLSILRHHNYERVSRLTISHSIPINDIQNLIPFLHTHKNQLVSLYQFEDLMTPENFAETYPIIRSITEEMIEIIDNLYENAREIRLNIRLCALLPCLQAAITTVQRMKTVPIELHCRGEVRAMIDPDYIQHAVENLLFNSCEACAGRPDGRILVEVQERGTLVKLTVQDNGVGIQRDSLRHVFEPFFSTRTKSHSWGMGLNHVFRVVRAHRGKVFISSTPGQGTSITLRLFSGR